jgi:ribosomal protein L37AE/L43A
MPEPVDPHPQLNALEEVASQINKAIHSRTFQIAFSLAWLYAINRYGGFLGGGLGWIPAIGIGFLATFLVPALLQMLLSCAILGLIALAGWLALSDGGHRFLSDNPLYLWLLIGGTAAVVIWVRRHDISAMISTTEWAVLRRQGWEDLRKLLFGVLVLAPIVLIIILLFMYPVVTALGLVLVASLGLVVVGWRNREQDAKPSYAHFLCPQCRKQAACRQPGGIFTCTECGHTFSVKRSPRLATVLPSRSAERQSATSDEVVPVSSVTSNDPRMVLGSSASLIYHRPDCDEIQGIQVKNRVPFGSSWDAAIHGYGPCKLCQPPSKYRHSDP